MNSLRRSHFPSATKKIGDGCRGLFLESAGNFSGPEGCFFFMPCLHSRIKVSITYFENEEIKLSVNKAKLFLVRSRE